MHGVSHEHYRNGVEQRAEYAHINESKPGSRPHVGLGGHEPQGAVLPRAAAPVVHAAAAGHARSPRCRRRTPTTTARPIRTRRARCCKVRRQVRQRRHQRLDQGLQGLPHRPRRHLHQPRLRHQLGLGRLDALGGLLERLRRALLPVGQVRLGRGALPQPVGREGEVGQVPAGHQRQPEPLLAQELGRSARGSTSTTSSARSRESGGTYTIDLSRVDPPPTSTTCSAAWCSRPRSATARSRRVTLTNGASVLGYWKDTFGYAYVVIGKNGNPQGPSRPEPSIEMTVTFGDQTMPSYVDLNGATYNVFGFDAGADRPRSSCRCTAARR